MRFTVRPWPSAVLVKLQSARLLVEFQCDIVRRLPWWMMI